ncbi:hypothetical protein RB195_013068 [Necator americanus]|uniref:Uncharacterized protein n=1 Tax=Necator americanus TaxID=51031 RepID=A0ABR1DTU7_NECAM
MNGVAALEQWQQPATSTADCAMTPLPSGLSSARLARFASGDTDFEDKPRSGRPHTVENSAILDVVKEDPEVNARSLATRLGCSHSVVSRLQAIGYRKVLSRWIPHILTDGTRFTRVSICQSLLLRTHRKEFLENLITEMRVGSFTNLSRTMPCGSLEEETRRRKPNRTSTPRSVSFVASGIRGECCFMSSSHMATLSTVTGSIYASQLQ